MTVTTRRTILKYSMLAGAAPIFGGFATPVFAADKPFAPATSDWRKYQTTTSIALPQGTPAQVWLPVPSLDNGYQRSLDDTVTGNAVNATFVTDENTGARMLHAEFDGKDAPRLSLISTFETRNRTIDWAQKTPGTETRETLAKWLKPSTMKPLDGVVGETAQKVTAGADTDVDKVKALYAWIVANCYRNLDTPGCGPGNAVATLTQAGLGGKCADLNGLFVAMARASGVPARDVYGVRVAPSTFGYKQLGANSDVITTAQHCRAEVYLSDYGWVAMDPADVLKVMRAESDTWIKDPTDPLVNQVNAALLGNWEGNWVGFNTTEDVSLPGRQATVPFLMYPQGTIAGRDLNELDAKAFSYSMTAKSV